MAVFSVLSDLENRAQIIGKVRRVVLRTPPPVTSGTVFREWRSRPVPLWSARLTISDFTPPKQLTFARRWFGLPLQAVFTVEPEGDGTRLTLSVEPVRWRKAWPGRGLSYLWKRQLVKDLADIGRYAAQRANPTWRLGLGRRNATSGGKRRTV